MFLHPQKQEQKIYIIKQIDMSNNRPGGLNDLALGF